MKKNVTFFFTGIICAVIGIFFFMRGDFSPQKSTPFGSQPIFREAQTLLNTYHTAPTASTLEDYLLHALVSSYGERFTEYFSPEETLSFQTIIDGDFEGIGAYVEESPSGIYISGVLPNSPSQQAGILPGDIIQTVDGVSMYGKTAHEAVQKIRGPAGSAVVLEIFSTVLGTKKTVTLVRQKLEIPITQSELLGGVLSIQLFSFNDHSGEDIARILEEYAGKQHSSILLDLRNNGGGTLQAAIDVASLFVGGGKEIASVEGSLIQKHHSQGSQTVQAPLVILVNGYTASAAEILASALRTYADAIIIGSQTYGKGSVQELFPLKNGGQLKITTAHWKTAQGEMLDGKGITPDVVILPTAQDITENRDIQKEKALEHLRKLSSGK